MNNIVELVARPIRVSLMQQWVDHYAGQDELARQLSKAMIDWANGAEWMVNQALHKLRKFGEYLFFETIPSQALL